MDSEIMERVYPKQAAKELNMDVDTLRLMMQVERLPIGYAFKKPGRKKYSYYIYRGLLEDYKKQLKGVK